jgi:hypothetical protein
METDRKNTIPAAAELRERAQEGERRSNTQTVRTGLQLASASRASARLRRLRGKVRFSQTLPELKADR